jgi:hypothetical protein
MSKVNQTRDVQAQSFGFAANVASAFGVPQNTTCTISSLAVTSAAVTSRSANDAAGMMILVSSSATFGTAGTVGYGTVQSNTSGTTPVFTVDGWYSLAGVPQASTYANSGLFYILLPVHAPCWYIALSDDVAAVAGTETGAAIPVTGGKIEISTNGLGRAQVDTITRTVGSTTATMAKTFTYSGATTQNIGRVALCNSAVLNKNYAYFITQINAGTPAAVSASGDTFTPLFTITVG